MTFVKGLLRLFVDPFFVLHSVLGINIGKNYKAWFLAPEVLITLVSVRQAMKINCHSQIDLFSSYVFAFPDWTSKINIFTGSAH